MNKILATIALIGLLASCSAQPAYAENAPSDSLTPPSVQKCYTLDQVKAINDGYDFKYVDLSADVAKVLLDGIEVMGHAYPERDKATKYLVAYTEKENEAKGYVFLQGYKDDGCMAAMEMIPRSVFDSIVGEGV